MHQGKEDRQLTDTFPLLNLNELITGPEDALRIDIVPGLPPSGAYKNIVKPKHVLSRYLLAYPTASQSANTIARVKINVVTKHAHLPPTNMSDKGSAFTSQVNKEVDDALGMTLKRATTKHAQTKGMLERTHDALTRICPHSCVKSATRPSTPVLGANPVESSTDESRAL